MRALIFFLGLLISSATHATLVLQGSSERGFPEIEYDPIKPPLPTVNLGTAFPDPPNNGVITRTFRIINQAPLGSGKINLAAISSTPEFRITGLTPSISPGTSDTFQISYRPSSTEAVEGLITINTDSAAQPFYPFEVRGAGGRVEARFENGARDFISNRPGETNTPLFSNDTWFGAVPQGSAAVTKDYFLVNRGSLPIDFTFQDDSSQASGLFSRTPNSPLTLQPGARQTISVTMSTDTVASGAQYRIGASDLSTFFIGFTVEGTVTASPEIALLNIGSETPITGYNFGTVATEFGTRNRNLRIKNVGQAPLEITSIDFDSPDGDFSFNGLSPRTLAPGASDCFNVTFTPTFGRQTTATLSIVSNDPASPASYTFRGTASLPPQPEIRIENYLGEPGEGLRVTFGGGQGTTTIRINEVHEDLIIIRNTGDGRATFGDLTLSPGFQFTEPLPQTLEAGGELYRTLEYRPSTIGFVDLDLSLDIEELPSPVSESATRRFRVLPALRDDLQLKITEIEADQIRLTVAPTTLADSDNEYRLMKSGDLRTWEVAQPIVNLYTSQFAYLQIPRDANSVYFRIERVPASN